MLSYISSGTSLLSPDACLVQALLPSMPVWIRIPSAWRGPPSLGCSRPKCHDPELFSCLHNHSRNHPDAPVKTNTRKSVFKSWFSLHRLVIENFQSESISQSVSEIATDRYINMQKKQCKPAKGRASQYWIIIIQHWLFCGQLILYFPSRVMNCTTKLEPEVVPSDARNMQ